MQHFFEDWRNFGNPQTFAKFLKFGVVLNFKKILIGRFITYTNWL